MTPSTQRFLAVCVCSALMLGAQSCSSPGERAAPVLAEESTSLEAVGLETTLDSKAHAFDFWLGDWECFGTDGTLGGTNLITAECAGLVLQEHWTDVGGGVGTSLNIYDAVTGLWHQTWVDEFGTLPQLDGGLDEKGRMVMKGTRPGRDGTNEVQHRIVWTPDAGTVRQVWDYSLDDGSTWAVASDLLYRK